MASICGSPVCAGGKPKMKFTYTGDYVVRKDGVVELLTSGTIVFLEPLTIDLFLVGGGASGSARRASATYKRGDGGGGGGYTKTVKQRDVTANESIAVVIGEGGVGADDPRYNNSGANGGTTRFGSEFAPGGKAYAPDQGYNGGDGGSGGGGGVAYKSSGGEGGTDGGNGSAGDAAGGRGQGTTTREFGEETGKLYAGGGGGGRYMAAVQPVVSIGGAGGGGTGAWAGDTKDAYQPAASGVANTGGGGGGGAVGTNNLSVANRPIGYVGAGGSGVVCFREAAPLPELAGTWVMNNQIYQPETTIKELVNFTMPGYTVAIYNAKGISITGAPATPVSILGIWKSTEATEQYLAVYDFYTNKWSNTKDLSPAVLTFPVGATASNEFRAWLASNATKQA